MARHFLRVRRVYPINLQEYRVGHRNGAAVPVRIMTRRHQPRYRRINWADVAGTILGVVILCALVGGLGWLIGRGL